MYHRNRCIIHRGIKVLWGEVIREEMPKKTLGGEATVI